MQKDNGDEAQEDAQLTYELFGRFRTKVVGTRYYTGVATLNEMVKLVREPENPYDRNAIRVANMRDDKIGHISRDLAANLTPLIDGSQLLVEGYVQGMKNSFNMPIDVICLGRPESRALVERSLRRAGVSLDTADPESFTSGRSNTTDTLSKDEMQDRLSSMFEDLLGAGSSHTMMDPRPEVHSELLPHQKVALAWMVQRENSTQLPPFWERQTRKEKENGRQVTKDVYCNTLTNFSVPLESRPAPLRGGLLADAMGLGKTLTVIALIATNRPGVELLPTYTGALVESRGSTQPTSAAAVGSKRPRGAGGGGDDVDGDVVVVEEKAATKGRRTVKSKASRSKAAACNDDDDADVVLVGEKPGRSEGKGKVQAAEQDGQPARKKAKSKSGLAVRTGHLPAAASSGTLTSTLAKAHAVKAAQEAANAAERDREHITLRPPSPDGPTATLVVCPLSVVSNWFSQLEEHTAGELAAYQYHGPNRNRSAAFLGKHDIVVTTYATLAADMPASGAARAGLLAVKWLRVVLDEGHTIKNSKTQQAQAATALRADRRWILSGTPVQNNLDDLHGLLAFLKLEPLNDKYYFTRTIARPIKDGDLRGFYKLKVLMHAIAMRRTKDTRVGGQPLVSLPSKTVHVVEVQLDDSERTAYARLESEGRAIISNHLRNETLLENYMSVLEIILRLRQVCNSAALVPAARLQLKSSAKGSSATPVGPEDFARLLGLLAEGASDECSICLAHFVSPCITRCGHVFCRTCIESVVLRSKAACPLCRSSVSVAGLIDAPTEKQQAEAEAEEASAVAAAGGGSSAKVKALIGRLLQNRAGAAGGASTSTAVVSGAPIKAVVFSQFLGMLGLVQAAMTQAGITFMRIDGASSAKARASALAAFQSGASGGPEVLLISLKAGGVGMNLTAASQVHLLDPWWNPSVEEQAMDRVHRLGQTSDVNVFRYIALDTIEERMLQLQERKRELASQVLADKHPDAARLARIADVQLLMRL